RQLLVTAVDVGGGLQEVVSPGQESVAVQSASHPCQLGAAEPPQRGRLRFGHELVRRLQLLVQGVVDIQVVGLLGRVEVVADLAVDLDDDVGQQFAVEYFHQLRGR